MSKLNIIKTLNTHLTELLENPHPDSEFWNLRVTECLKSIASLIGTPEKKIRWDLLKCREASMFSRETFIPCGKPATSLVWHNKDKRAYPMCDMCADHNIKNRGGIELAKKEIE